MIIKNVPAAAGAAAGGGGAALAGGALAGGALAGELLLPRPPRPILMKLRYVSQENIFF